MASMSSTNRSPLNNDQLARVAPAIFAQAPASDLSARYSFLPTIQVVDAMRAAGWQPVYAGQSRCRVEEARGEVRHVVRFSHPDMKLRGVGDTVPELVLFNSHDGSSAYQLHAGLFRFVCGNGMVVCDATFDKVSVRHTSTTISDIVDASFRVIDEVPALAQSVEGMRALTLDAGERRIFAEAATKLRWEDEKETPVKPVQLLTTRRHDDRKDDLYTTLNVVQENIIRGGVPGKSTTGRRMRTRAVASVNEDTKLNKALWHLAEEMRRLKAA